MTSIKMKFAIFLPASSALIFLIACAAQASKDQAGLKAVRIIKTVPDVDITGRSTHSKTFEIDCYFLGDLRIYRIPTEQDSVKADSVVSLGYYLDRFFVHHKDSSYGQIFYPERSDYQARANVDAEIIKPFLDLQLSMLFERNKVTLISTDTIPSLMSIKDVFRISNITDSAPKGMLELNYTKAFDDIPFHLSPFMDSIKQRKVISYKLDALARVIPETGLRIDPLTFEVKMKRIENPDKKKIMEYVIRYTKENLQH